MAKKKVQEPSAGLGFDRINLVHGSTYKDCSTAVVIPTRGMIHCKVATAIQNLIAPMNQKRILTYVQGDEVGKAYNRHIEAILAHPELSKFRYLLSIEDDNIVPPDAHIRLIESLEECKLDAVSGIYFTKGGINMPMAYGNAEAYKQTGVLDFAPLDIRQSLQQGQIIEVNGIACGCALWRMDMFKQLPPPWFVTVSDVVPGKGVECMTQDLFWCKRAKEAGKRLGVDFRVKVGHIDITDGVVY